MGGLPLLSCKRTAQGMALVLSPSHCDLKLPFTFASPGLRMERNYIHAAEIAVLVFLLSASSLFAYPLNDASKCLSVPESVFTSVVKSAILQTKIAISLVSKIAGQFTDSRVSIALKDCCELLDFTSDELRWSLAAVQSRKGEYKGTGTGSKSADLRAWLSAAYGNQDTCLDGLHGYEFVKQLLEGCLHEVTLSVGKALSMVRGGQRSVFHGEGRKLLGGGEGLEWVSAADRKLLQAAVGEMKMDVTVAQDGTGNYTTVMEAVNAAPDASSTRFVIHVRSGEYVENVEISRKKQNLMIVGDGMDTTLISANRSYVDGWTTFRSATFATSGVGTILRDITLENSAGPAKHQAVAFRSDSDLSVCYRCRIKGYQDTLYTHSLRQFYRECDISGTVDFIFGNAQALFQNCQIAARTPLPHQKNTVTAQGRKHLDQITGFSIQFCNITASADLLPLLNSTATYLGRPWKQFSTTIVMQSYISTVIHPQGWLEWNGDFAVDTLYYAEYMNFGPGAEVQDRINWKGYHVLNHSSEVQNFTVEQFINGNSWLPATGITYTKYFNV